MELHLVECKEKELLELKEEYCLVLHWYGDACYKVTKNNRTIALLEAAIIFDRCVEIYGFEVMEKGKGLGREIVNDIIDQGYDICLYVNDSRSKKFWEALGFKEEADGTGETKKHFYRQSST